MALKVKPQIETVIINDGKQPLDPHWFAMVKNTPEGRLWLKEFRQKNRHLKVTRYCRHSDRKFVYNELMGLNYDYEYAAHNITQQYAERLAVYIERKDNKAMFQLKSVPTCTINL